MTTYNNEILNQNIEKILTELGTSFRITKNRVYMPCPIHGGKKSTGLSIALDRGLVWSCWTNHCEETYGKGFIGLVRGILTTTNNTEYSYGDAIQWIENLIGVKITEHTESRSNFKSESIKIAEQLNKKSQTILGVNRHIVRQSLQIPSKYFLGRGFSKETLEKYDVGDCFTKGKQMFNRAVVPIYDDDGCKMVGCTGRSLNPKCVKCERFHNINTPCPFTSYDEYQSEKWINSSGFNIENYLFNFWYAKEYIALYNTAILVEGQGDVLKLEEANIKIGLGTFGAKITDEQAIKLEQLPIINLLVASDNDIAGIKAKNQILEKLSRYYNIVIINLPSAHDVGDMSILEIKNFFNPILSKYIKV